MRGEMKRPSKQFISPKPIPNLERRRLLRIRAVNRVLFNRAGKLLTDRPLFGIRRIGRTHQLAQVGNRVVLLEHQQHNWPGGHERSQSIKERTLLVYVIKSLRLLF